ncbi:hypothetical protein P5673_006453 [Acropora cervicornis]|uniref:Uncharacterized protein n=1 Tax=Acropora cervicornis TaxID=6130 RepID=A0AAD9VBR9_ACRCE|nr:hypothetical protein P5673_006453 [Acropora cervicornis]
MNTFVEFVLVYGTLHPSSWPHSIDKDLLRILQMTDDVHHFLPANSVKMTATETNPLLDKHLS